jgi:hypothetical protein
MFKKKRSAMKREKIKIGSVIIKTDGIQPMVTSGYQNNGKRSNFCIGFPLEVVIMRCRLDMALCLILLFALLLVGCASQAEKGKLPDDVASHLPDIQLGEELILLEKAPILSSSLIDKEGSVHIFVVDQAKQLNHIEILDNKIITREFLGKIETEQVRFLDAIEHPPGKLRVLAGDKQYFQVAPDLEWQEIKGNRCARFVPVGDDLFCAFVINGEEISAPERNDYTYGWFLLVPIFYWSHEHASKLVLAQESLDGWIVRAVVDPDISMDTDDDFMIGTDSLGNIHFLYFTSKGGGTFIVGFGGSSGVAYSSEPEPKLRYAQLTFDQLLAHSTDAQNQALSNNSSPKKWMTIKGFPLTHIPFIKLKPLSRKFLVNKATGGLNGLILASKRNLDNGVRHLALFRPGPNQSWMEISIHDGYWSPRFNIVTTEGFPTSGTIWRDSDNLSIKLDGKGKYHLLLESFEGGFWKRRKYMNYLLKGASDWYTPLTLGSSHLASDVISLAVDDSGIAFAAWVNEERKFIGRLIKPRSGDIQ